MSSIKYTQEEFKTYLEMDKSKHLLVEGSGDMRFFQILFEELLGVNWDDRYKILIDKAESLISSDNASRGNRDKVESICDSYAYNNLTGFVDREFRGFEISNNLIDQIREHYYNNKKIVWSRGHSIENYFFNAELLRKPFRDINSELYQAAYSIFRNNIHSYLKTACLISLVGRNYQNKLNRFETSITWQAINSNGTLHIEEWKSNLSSRAGFTSDEVDQIFKTLTIFTSWIEDANIEVIRWLCHGHIGFRFLWCAFASCIYATTDGDAKTKNKAANSFYSTKEKLQFDLCVTSFAEFARKREVDYPTKILELLEVQ